MLEKMWNYALPLLKFLATALASGRKGYSSDYSKHAFATCDRTVIEQPCFHTYE